jgi:hypothetical protein
MFKNYFLKQNVIKPKLITDILQIIILYLSPLELVDFFEQYGVPFDFKFKYDMSHYGIHMYDYDLLNTNVLLNNYIDFNVYKFIRSKFKNIIITGIKLKCNVKNINFKWLSEQHLYNMKHIDLCGEKNDIYNILLKPSIINISFLENFTNLETFSIKYFNLKSDYDICKINCSSMHTLVILNCNKANPFKFTLVGDYSKLRNLEFEEGFFNNIPTHILTNLLKLNYYYQDDIAKLSEVKYMQNMFNNLSKYNNIECLTLNNMTFIDLLDIHKMHSIKSITFSMCGFISNIERLAECVNLKEIHISNNLYATNFNFLGQCKKLESLTITNNYLNNLNFLENLYNLKKLKIERCDDLDNVDIIKTCINLEHLSIINCENLYVVNINNKKLKYIKLQFVILYSINQQILGFENCSELETLHISNLQIENIDFLNTCNKIKVLRINHSLKIKYLNISNLTKCTKLIISYCYELENIYTNNNIYNFETVVISDCNKLKKINFLGNCRNLNVLILYDNYNLNYVDDLRNCKKLYYVYLQGPYIKNIDMLRLHKRSDFKLDMKNIESYNNTYNHKYDLLCYYARSYILENKCNLHHGIFKKILYELYTELKKPIFF